MARDVRGLHAFRGQLADLVDGDGARAALIAPLGLGLLNALLLALSPDGRLKLREPPEDREEQAARRGGGVKLSLLESLEPEGT